MRAKLEPDGQRNAEYIVRSGFRQSGPDRDVEQDATGKGHGTAKLQQSHVLIRARDRQAANPCVSGTCQRNPPSQRNTWTRREDGAEAGAGRIVGIKACSTDGG